VPLLKSLICLKGRDNGRRFLIISSLCYILLVILTPILNRAMILLILLLLSVTPVLVASSLRRIHDAGFATPFAAIPALVYWLNVFGLTYLEHGAKWGLLLLGFLTSLAIGTISNAKIRRNYQYILGYSGPVSLSEPTLEPTSRDRIEPTIASASADKTNISLPDDGLLHSTSETHDFYSDSSTNDINKDALNEFHSWEQKLSQWFIANKKLSLIIIGLVSVYILAEILFAIFSDPKIVEQPKKEIQSVEEVKQRIDKIEMPDSFWVMLDQNNAITIAWEGDFKSETDLEKKTIYWSATTAKGDKECTNLHFSLGADIKTLLVTVKNGGDYYADFSPVDSELIIKSVADKDRFKLCGYEFTLKGTRSLLRDNRKYREYLMAK